MKLILVFLFCIAAAEEILEYDNEADDEEVTNAPQATNDTVRNLTFIVSFAVRMVSLLRDAFINED